MHYALRSREEGIYSAALTAQHGQRFKQYVAAEGARLRVNKLLSAQTPGTHVYVVGPRRLIQSVVDAARAGRFPLRAIHWDAYGWRPNIGVDEQHECDMQPLNTTNWHR
jgi:ferredoxin-NADP reductase